VPRDLDSAAAALARLLGDAGLRERCGRAGRELLESRLSWDANAAMMEQFFRGAMTEQVR
jgi:glycosyltransferase involved in cell wall biosynthesis